jgi:hypothetical protein
MFGLFCARAGAVTPSVAMTMALSASLRFNDFMLISLV